MSKRLEGLVAIVAGGGRGIGEAISTRFAREGAAVAIADVDAEAAQRVAEGIVREGGAAIGIAADVREADAVAAVVSAVLAKWRSIDVLANVAGGFDKFLPIAEITDDEWGRVIDHNLKTAFVCARAVVPLMMERKRGRIINIASQAGITANPHGPSYLPYGAAKAGVIGFTKLLARDLGPYGITVNAISPGTTATARVRRLRDPESLARIAALNPMRHMVEPEDTAAAAVFLASEEARYITGVNFNVNAGAVM